MKHVVRQGVKWPAPVSEDSLAAIKHFEVKDDDVWVATYPKAGTHWTAEICHLICANGEVDKVDRQQQPMPIEFEMMPTESEKEKFGGTKRKPRYIESVSWKSPRVLVTHVPKRFLPEQILTQKKGKVVVVIRNPKDSQVSDYFFSRHLSPSKDITSFAEFLETQFYCESVMYTSWYDHVLEYWAERNNKQYLILKYEDMKKDTRGAVIQLADHLGRPLSEEVVDKITDSVTVKSMKTRYHAVGEKREFSDSGASLKVGAPSLVRKGIVGDWKTMFTVAQNEVFDKIYEDKMAGTGLKLQFQ